jgi:3-oxoacyl-[acyl-carrier-protein] synthase-3
MLVTHLLSRLRQVRRELGLSMLPDDGGLRFVDAVDSMGMAEFLALLADDCGVSVAALERAAGRRFGTVTELAAALAAAGLRPVPKPASEAAPPAPLPEPPASAWLAATATRLPAAVQPSTELDVLMDRPPGWLKQHAGIRSRRIWEDEDPLDASAEAGRAALDRAGVPLGAVGALLVTSEAPPTLLGLAADLHHRLALPSGAVALEVGGACTGFLAALWMAARLLPATEAVLVIGVECHSQRLAVRPGPAGEAAALFGDGAAACVLTALPAGSTPFRLRDVDLGTDGGAAGLLQAHPTTEGGVALAMQGIPLAGRAVRALAASVRGLIHRRGLTADDLAAVVAHGGNGRLPGLLARHLDLPAEKVWSETESTGNLGACSLPVAWAARNSVVAGPAIWTAVGAGLTWGGALLEPAC